MYWGGWDGVVLHFDYVIEVRLLGVSLLSDTVGLPALSVSALLCLDSVVSSVVVAFGFAYGA